MYEECIRSLRQAVYTECYRCGLHYRLNTIDADICAVEFTEEILLFLDLARRNLLLAPENRGLLHRRAVWFVLDWRKRGGLGRLAERPLSDLDRNVSLPISHDPLALTHNAYVHKVLRRAVDCLPPKQRECSVHYWFLQETDTEIAQCLSMTPTAVRKNLQHARAKLPGILKQMGVDLEDLL